MLAYLATNSADGFKFGKIVKPLIWSNYHKIIKFKFSFKLSFASVIWSFITPADELGNGVMSSKMKLRIYASGLCEPLYNSKNWTCCSLRMRYHGPSSGCTILIWVIWGLPTLNYLLRILVSICVLYKSETFFDKWNEGTNWNKSTTWKFNSILLNLYFETFVSASQTSYLAKNLTFN